MRAIAETVSEDTDSTSFYASVSDLMAGLVFVFILTLMVFALFMSEEQERRMSMKEDRTELLNEIKNTLESQGISVAIDLEQGVLRFAESMLFETGQDTLGLDGRRTLKILGEALMAVVPCYCEIPEGSSHPDCGERGRAGRIDTILIEGHTDKKPIRSGPGARIRDNWDLSAARAISVYRELTRKQPELGFVMNRVRQPVLSVSGYGEGRPVPGRIGDTEEDFSMNRRIDLRFIMVPRTAEELSGTGEELPKPAKEVKERVLG